MGISYSDTNPKPGDRDNVLLAKILQRLDGSPESGDRENNLLRKILEQLNGFAEPGDTNNMVLQKILDFFNGEGGGGGDPTPPDGVDLFTYNSGTGSAFSSDLLTEFTSNFWIDADILGGSFLESVEFPNLTEVGGYFALTNHPNFTTLDLSSLVTVGDGTFGLQLVNLGDVGNVGSLSVLSFPALVTVNGDLLLQNNGNLGSISAPLVTTISMEVNAENCTNLTTVNLASWLPTNGQIVSFANCDLNVASVNHILARCVANAAYVTGTVDLSNGTNAAPAGQGAADVITLTGRGVTVTTN